MMFAGHLPTKVFTLAEWQAMKIDDRADKNDGTFLGDGTYRSTLRGRPIVFHTSWKDDGVRFHHEGWAVRPIVRVPMGRA